jgi:hypothetical protein
MAETATKSKKSRKVYDLVCKKPVARFYYQGSHSHPIRRTVLVIEETDTYLTGYEVRCGNTVRSVTQLMEEQAVRTYRKDKIAKWGDYSRLRQTSRTFLKDPDKTTLERFPILTMFTDGA